MRDVITIGTATRDMFLKSELFRIVRDSEHLRGAGFPTGVAECFSLGSKVEIDEVVLSTGGGATNTAVTFARQGLDTAALIKIGDDDPGESVIVDLKKEGIKPLAIKTKEGQTAHGMVLLNKTGERTILVYRGVANDFRVDELPMSKLKARWGYISPGTVKKEVLETIIKRLRATGTLIAMNPSKHYLEIGIEELRPVLDHLDVVVMNREEASYLTGIRYEDEREIFKRLDGLVRGIAVMTEGAKGVMVSDGRTLYRAGIYKEKEVVDRTGAGDAFASGFVAGLIARKEEFEGGKPDPDNVEYAIKLGSANATSVVEHIGAKTGVLTKEQFEENENWKNLDVHTESL